MLMYIVFLGLGEIQSAKTYTSVDGKLVLIGNISPPIKLFSIILYLETDIFQSNSILQLKSFEKGLEIGLKRGCLVEILETPCIMI